MRSAKFVRDGEGRDWWLVTCDPWRSKRGLPLGTEDTELDWTRAVMGAARRMGTVGGEVAGEEGG